MENINVKTKIAVAIVTLALPVAYLIGYFFIRGYLYEYGIDAAYFPLTVPQTLASAADPFLMLLLHALQFLLKHVFWLLAIFPASIIAIIIIRKENRLSTWVKSKLNSMKSETSKTIAASSFITLKAAYFYQSYS